jgi:hypothetical protein
MLKGWLANRTSSAETFAAFARRHEIEALQKIFSAEVAE